MKNSRVKRSLGKSIQTKEEAKRKGILGSYRYSLGWLKRGEAIRARVARKINRVQVRKAERLQALKDDKPVVYSIK